MPIDTVPPRISPHRETFGNLIAQIKAREDHKLTEYLEKVSASRHQSWSELGKQTHALCAALEKALKIYVETDQIIQGRVDATVVSFRKELEEATRRAEEEYEKRVEAAHKAELGEVCGLLEVVRMEKRELERELEEVLSEKKKNQRTTAGAAASPKRKAKPLPARPGRRRVDT